MTSAFGIDHGYEISKATREGKRKFARNLAIGVGAGAAVGYGAGKVIAKPIRAAKIIDHPTKTAADAQRIKDSIKIKTRKIPGTPQPKDEFTRKRNKKHTFDPANLGNPVKVRQALKDPNTIWEL